MSDFEKALIRRARATARLEGCKCSPEITINEIGRNTYEAQIGHGPDCPLAPGGDERKKLGIVNVFKEGEA